MTSQNPSETDRTPGWVINERITDSQRVNADSPRWQMGTLRGGGAR